MKIPFYLNRLLIGFLILSLFGAGCLSKKSEQSVVAEATAETDEPATVAEIELSSAKSTYQKDEAIPLELTFRTGKFDLFVPSVVVTKQGAFTRLVVKDAKGRIVKPKYPISMASHPKILLRKGREVRSIPGIELKAQSEKKAVLEDLTKYYKLGAGDYTLHVPMTLKVYRESLADQSPQILELERDIARLQANAKLPADAKQEAIGFLREDIEAIREKQPETSDQVYLPLDTLRGSADLESNVISLTIVSE
jgi:hypothetical protein